jgi:probable rRNA maturation factor
MIDVEVFGASLAPEAPAQQVRRLCEAVAARMGVEHAHVAVEFVDVARIAELNAAHRHKPEPTDVLSFPIDGVQSDPGAPGSAPGAAARRGDGGRALRERPVPRELGDIVICPQLTADLREAIVHGMLHLMGMDHETDDGEMLALQRELLTGAGG